MCKIKACELILGAIILVFAFIPAAYSVWIIVIAAILLIIHSFMPCKMCCCNDGKCDMEMQAKPARPSKPRRK